MLYVIREWDGTFSLVDVVFHTIGRMVDIIYQGGVKQNVSQQYFYQELQGRVANNDDVRPGFGIKFE